MKTVHDSNGNQQIFGRVGVYDGTTMVFYPKLDGGPVIVTKAGVFRVTDEGAVEPSELSDEIPESPLNHQSERWYVKFVREFWERIA